MLHWFLLQAAAKGLEKGLAKPKKAPKAKAKAKGGKNDEDQSKEETPKVTE